MLVRRNGLTQKEIAEKLGLEGPTLIPIIDKMEEEGLVVRKVDSSDRRNNRIYYTERVEALWDRMMECASKVRQTALKGISEVDINIMRTSLDKIWYNLRDEFGVSRGYNVDTARISGNASAVKGSTVRHAALSSSTRRIKKNRS
jgi:MarR family transcriptional regulator for hemolysin